MLNRMVAHVLDTSYANKLAYVQFIELNWTELSKR